VPSLNMVSKNLMFIGPKGVHLDWW